MRILAALVLTALAAPAASVASAEPAPDVTKMAHDDCARAREAGKTCVLDIAAEDVDGTVVKSDQISTAVIQFTQASSLIHIRTDFIPEILKTAEDL